MSDTARDYQTATAATTDGMDDLFHHGLEALQDGSLEGVEVALEAPPDGLPLSEAAKILGLHRRYALDLVHKGKLVGFKNSKGQWFITEKSINARRPNCASEQLEIPLLEGGGESLEVLQEGFDGAVEVLQEGAPDVRITDNSLVEKLIRELQDKLENKDHHLQAANYRIGYLESQLENQREQIKLLTDSQHKGGWWARFSSWFFGRG
jgi:Helix-turn-helix domain